MHKKILCLILLLGLIVSLVGCAGKPSEALLKSNSDNSIVFLKYSADGVPNTPNSDIEIPDNYAPISDNIFAVLDSNNEITSYKILVFDETSNKKVFKDCDANGNIIGSSNDTTELKSIALNSENAEVKVGETVTISVATDPVDYKITDAKWESSDNNIATVTDGVITGKKEGTVEIKVTIGEFSKVCKVNVIKKTEETKPVKPTSVKLSKTSMEIYIGNSSTLSATVSPSNADNKSVTWTSSNTDIATVYNGVVTGKSAGKTTITATNSAGQTATCTVTVSKKPVEQPKPVVTTGISLNKTSLTLNVGGTETLSATVLPSNADNKSVTWSSSNNSVVTVSNGSIKAVGAGSATITAKASGGQTATCTVTVNKPVDKFSWQTISQSGCPLNISAEFDKYILTGSAKNLAYTKDGYTYVMLKAAGSGKISVSSVTESGGKITIKYSNSGFSNYVFIKFNRENTNITYTN